MKKKLFTMAMAGLFALAAGQILANDQCLMCHQGFEENKVEAHQDCMACHAGNADEHMANIRIPPDPVTDATCTTCHQETEDFMAIRAHQMGMECTACHTIHED